MPEVAKQNPSFGVEHAPRRASSRKPWRPWICGKVPEPVPDAGAWGPAHSSARMWSQTASPMRRASNSGAADTVSWPEQRAMDSNNSWSGPRIGGRTRQRSSPRPATCWARRTGRNTSIQLMCKEADTEAHSIVDNTPMEKRAGGVATTRPEVPPSIRTC